MRVAVGVESVNGWLHSRSSFKTTIPAIKTANPAIKIKRIVMSPKLLRHPSLLIAMKSSSPSTTLPTFPVEDDVDGNRSAGLYSALGYLDLGKLKTSVKSMSGRFSDSHKIRSLSC